MAAKAIHSVLATYANTEGIAFPSQQTIGDLLGVSSRHVRNGISELKEAGLLIRESGRGQKCARYKLAPIDQETSVEAENQPFECGTILPLERNSSSAQCGTVVPPSTEQFFRSTRKNTSAKAEQPFRLLEEYLLDPLLEELPALAEQFFKRYPKRTELHLAESYFSGYSTEEAKGALEGLNRWLASVEWQKDDGKYIPSPAKFLAQRRWKDFPEPAKQPSETPLFLDEEAA